MDDRTAFGLAFLAVWGGLAAYFVFLHLRQARLAREVEAIERRMAHPPLQGSERKLK